VSAFGPPPFLPSNAFILGIMILAAVMLVFFKGEYKRLQHEGENTHLESDNELTKPMLDARTGESFASGLPRRNTKGSDDVNLVRVASNEEGSTNSNNSQAFAQSSSAAHGTSANIWNVSRPASVPLSRHNSLQ
jgi:hypothetical protein